MSFHQLLKMRLWVLVHKRFLEDIDVFWEN